MVDKLGGHSVLFVMAADAEYGPHLRARITPLMTGVGPVEGGVALAASLATMTKKPALIVSLGSAGSNSLKQAEVYQVASVTYRDMDASPLGFEKGRTPFIDLPARVDLPHDIPGLPKASLSTGGNIISGPAYADIAEDMVDMETFAHLRAAMRFDVPLIGLRGISDGNEALQKLADWTQYLPIIDEKLAYAVDRLAAALEAGSLRP